MPNKRFLFAALFLGSATFSGTAAAQVGYPPARSPFRDLEYKQELTLFGGWFNAGKDPAGVAPRSAPVLGFRYDATIGGPMQLYGRLAYVISDRNQVDPSKPAATRSLGTVSSPILLIDAGIGLNLTGMKSYRKLVPYLAVGAGVASGLGSQPDIAVDDSGKGIPDPYEFGTSFALTYGGGFKFVPGGRFQVRVGLDGYLYKLGYPQSYYIPASDGTAVLPAKQAKDFWKNNFALTIGASYLFFR